MIITFVDGITVTLSETYILMIIILNDLTFLNVNLSKTQHVKNSPEYYLGWPRDQML